MYQWIYSIVITLLMAGCAMQHETPQEKKPALKQLYSKLFGVFDQHIAQAETIYISPDGLTHQIAFSRLILPDGQFWVQRQTLCRIQTSRDLMDQNKTIGNQGTLVAMGHKYQHPILFAADDLAHCHTHTVCCQLSSGNIIRRPAV